MKNCRSSIFSFRLCSVTLVRVVSIEFIIHNHNRNFSDLICIYEYVMCELQGKGVRCEADVAKKRFD